MRILLALGLVGAVWSVLEVLWLARMTSSWPHDHSRHVGWEERE
jgi:hypothetical protein